jgi:hypothetical protein
MGASVVAPVPQAVSTAPPRVIAETRKNSLRVILDMFFSPEKIRFELRFDWVFHFE